MQSSKIRDDCNVGKSLCASPPLSVQPVKRPFVGLFVLKINGHSSFTPPRRIVSFGGGEARMTGLLASLCFCPDVNIECHCRSLVARFNTFQFFFFPMALGRWGHDKDPPEHALSFGSTIYIGFADFPLGTNMSTKNCHALLCCQCQKYSTEGRVENEVSTCLLCIRVASKIHKIQTDLAVDNPRQGPSWSQESAGLP